MDIFKLGDKILALLEAMFGFWNNQISLVFAMLGQSPVSFKGGGPWAVIEGIEPIFVAVGVIILAKNVMEFAQAYQQQDSSTMNSALKGVVAGIIMAGISTVLTFLGF